MSFTPSAAKSALVNVVFPAPKSPFSKIISLPSRLFAIFSANLVVSFTLFEIYSIKLLYNFFTLIAIK